MAHLRRAGFFIALVAALVAVAAAVETSRPESPFCVMPPDHTGIRFHHRNGAQGQKQMIEIMGSGVALFDYNGDGRLDVFFVNSALLPSLQKTDETYRNRLYRNDGGFRFTDVTESAGVGGTGYGMGAAAGDYDNDGQIDLYVTQVGHNQLLHDLGNGHFEDVTEAAHVAAGGWSTSAAFLDYDRDGYLDLFVARYLVYPVNKHAGCGDRSRGIRSYCLPDQFQPSTNLLFHNNRDGTFTDVSEKSGISSFRGKALGVAVADLDGDGWPDLVVTNDRMPNALFRNRRDGTFQEIGMKSGIAYSSDGIARAGMGVDVGDFDGDGKPDIIISNFEAEGIALFHSQASMFEDESGMRGLYEPSYKFVGFGLKFLDYDNDGWPDIFSINGHVLDDIGRYRPGSSFEEPKLIFHNRGGHFEPLVSSGDLARRFVGRGAAFGDLNNDGWIDAVVSNNNQIPEVIANQHKGNSNQSVLLTFQGAESNRDGLGTRAVARIGSHSRSYEVSGSGSYLSQSDTRLHIGLGVARKIDELEIFWPSGQHTVLQNLPAG
jgi:hypothetical protein